MAKSKILAFRVEADSKKAIAEVNAFSGAIANIGKLAPGQARALKAVNDATVANARANKENSATLLNAAKARAALAVAEDRAASATLKAAKITSSAGKTVLSDREKNSRAAITLFDRETRALEVDAKKQAAALKSVEVAYDKMAANAQKGFGKARAELKKNTEQSAKQPSVGAIGAGSFSVGQAAGWLAVGTAAKVAYDWLEEGTVKAADLAETMNKVEVVFGSASDSVKSWSETAVDRLGQTQNQALDAASTYGALLKSAGFADSASAKLSQQITERATDISSLYNADLADVLGDITSELTGQVEPMRKYGVFASEAAVSAEAFALGLGKIPPNSAKVASAQKALEIAHFKAEAAVKKFGAGSVEAASANLRLEKANAALAKAVGNTNGKLSEQDKVTARASLLMKQSAIAAGDYAKTSDSAANANKRLSAEVDTLQMKLGQDLLPMRKGVIQFFSAVVRGASDAATATHNYIASIDAANKKRLNPPKPYYYGNLKGSVAKTADEVGTQLGRLRVQKRVLEEERYRAKHGVLPPPGFNDPNGNKFGTIQNTLSPDERNYVMGIHKLKDPIPAQIDAAYAKVQEQIGDMSAKYDKLRALEKVAEFKEKFSSAFAPKPTPTPNPAGTGNGGGASTGTGDATGGGSGLYSGSDRNAAAKKSAADAKREAKEAAALAKAQAKERAERAHEEASAARAASVEITRANLTVLEKTLSDTMAAVSDLGISQESVPGFKKVVKELSDEIAAAKKQIADVTYAEDVSLGRPGSVKLATAKRTVAYGQADGGTVDINAQVDKLLPGAREKSITDAENASKASSTAAKQAMDALKEFLERGVSSLETLNLYHDMTRPTTLAAVEAGRERDANLRDRRKEAAGAGFQEMGLRLIDPSQGDPMEAFDAAIEAFNRADMEFAEAATKRVEQAVTIQQKAADALLFAAKTDPRKEASASAFFESNRAFDRARATATTPEGRGKIYVT